MGRRMEEAGSYHHLGLSANCCAPESRLLMTLSSVFQALVGTCTFHLELQSCLTDSTYPILRRRAGVKEQDLGRIKT